MKYFIVLVVVLLVAWRWRSARSNSIEVKQQRKNHTQPQPTDMAACRHCGLHLPTADALPGRDGSYCSPEHRTLAEG
jgi:uncharacterized protein